MFLLVVLVYGKTYAIKYFVNNLNKGLYKSVYLCLSTVTVMDFYRSLCIGLGIIPSHRKIDMFNQIQETIKTLVKDRKITPVILLDEVQYMRTEILNDLKMLLNFDMDSKEMTILILVGQPTVNDTLSRNTHESLKQRVVVNYTFAGLDFIEVSSYLKDRIHLAGLNENIIEENALKALAANCNGATRKLNSLIEKCLLICEQKNESVITAEIVMLAENDMNFI